MPRGLSEGQASTAIAIKEKMDARGVDSPLALPRADIVEAHREGYPNLAGADANTVSSYVSSNLKSPAFMAALGFDCNELRQHIGNHILANLAGSNPKFPDDKDLYRDSLKIAAGLAFETKSRVTIEGDFRTRSDSDLEFYASNGRWPEDAPTIEAQ
jgi:hypothetical protein